MKARPSCYILGAVLLLTALFSCVETAPTKEVRLVDSLNQRAYEYRYKNLDSSFRAASQAYKHAAFYRVGKAEACNNLGFRAFMRMDFEEAEQLYKEVYKLTRHELELLIADIGLMKIYQRTAMNKEFYDHRNSAVRRMKRIDEDKNLFIDKREHVRLNYAYTEFYIVSAVYYYYLQQHSKAAASLLSINKEEIQAADTNRQMYYHYIRGAVSSYDGNTSEEKSLNEFDELYNVWSTASRHGCLYFEGNGLQGLADLLMASDKLTLLKARRSHAMKQLGAPGDSLLPLHLAQKALSKFREYDDNACQSAGTYVSIGKYLNTHGQYAQALDTLTKALDEVNLHHRMHYSDGCDSSHILKPFIDRDTAYTELIWLGEGKIKTVPDQISRIREQLSVSYAGLGMKIHSNYNRNIYLDILDYTRQDKELENRYFYLQQESKKLNVILLVFFVGIIGLFILLSLFNRRSRRRSRKHVARLKQTLDICGKITASIPANVTAEDEIIRSMIAAVYPDMESLFQLVSIRIKVAGEETEDSEEEEIRSGVPSVFHLYVPDKKEPLGSLELITRHRLTKDEQALIRVITPYIAWVLNNGMTFISLGEERKKLEKQRYVYEQHIARNKRENLVKKACFAIVTGIIPYIDRIKNEVHKLTDKGFIKDAAVKKEKYQYIDELVTTINEYNDILALWIKMKQGALRLNIENFALEELFLLVAKGRRTFEMKRQTFEAVPTPAIVKADKALTLFMINTLTENARKYTPEGGTIRLYADTTEEYAEISVTDNGPGLSAADVERIVGEVIYDSRFIGMQNATDAEELKRNKGNGFGLMNCKGIIETYRKTNRLFQVCTFNVESTPGKGSRFYFRLPMGIRKSLGMWCCLFLSFSLFSCGHRPEETTDRKIDTPACISETDDENPLNAASRYADTAYFHNVEEKYELALQYIDSAIICLNRHYEAFASPPYSYMNLIGNEPPAELEWWANLFDTDFHVILDIRNEAAVSFLALKEWEAYAYNNTAYTNLYKLLGEDRSLEAYCRELEGSASNKIAGIILCILLIITFFIGYYVLFVRKRLTNRWNLEQVLEINKKVFAASLVRPQESDEALLREEEALKNIPQHIVNEAFDAVNELLAIDGISISVFNETTNRLEFASFPRQESMPEIVQTCFNKQTYLSDDKYQALPLPVEANGKQQCVGVLCLEKQEGTGQEADRLLFELITRYVAVVVYNAVVRSATKYRNIESAHEEVRRASWEDSLLHVQNMVLDNCLSTIKHETIYYPNKIKQMIGRLNSLTFTEAEEKESIETIGELTEYYKGIFTLLSSRAGRQLEEVTFRRNTVRVPDLFEHAEKYFAKANKRNAHRIAFSLNSIDKYVTGDVNQLHFLLENLIDEALNVPSDGELLLRAVPDGEYIRFFFTDKRREKSAEELKQLFYPNLASMTPSPGEKESLKGTEYLICKQIIRDHDEFAGRRGCRINAEACLEGGFTVYFTIPVGFCR